MKAMIACFLCLVVLGVRADELPASALHPFGRWMLTGNRDVELIGSAVHFGFRFTGSECAVEYYLPAGTSHNYLQYELDGVYGGRVKIEGGGKPMVIRAGSAGVHTVWVYKATEAMNGAVFVRRIKGAGLAALQRGDAPVIEFIGNSITCGALADASEMACGLGEYEDHHNAYYAYGPRVARTLGVNYFLSSVSGIGIYRTWNRDTPSMPQVYAQADFSGPGGRAWDFGRIRPAIVSIALGTNDLSHGDGKTPRAPFDSARFVDTYCQFVRTVKQHYPATQIALLSSPMVGGAERELLQHCLEAVKRVIDGENSGGKRVALFFFEPMEPRGCSYHPSVEDHAVLAKELEPFFRKLLGQ